MNLDGIQYEFDDKSRVRGMLEKRNFILSGRL